MIYRKVALLFSLICFAISVQAQEAAQKKPKIIFYDADNKLANIDKLNADLKKYVATHLLSERRYNNDSVVYKVERMPREMLLKDSMVNVDRLAGLKALEGTPAKDFTLSDLAGKAIKLSELKGKIVVLNFWFTKCTPCIDEIAELNKLTSMYKNSKVRFLAITFDKAQAVQNFQKEHGFKFELLPDAKMVTDDYGIKRFPQTMVIDKAGIIRLAINNDEHIFSKVKDTIDAL
jgi:peroxiredoxin